MKKLLLSPAWPLALSLIIAGTVFAQAVKQETPVGDIAGTVIAEETGNRLPARVVLREVTLETKDKTEYGEVFKARSGSEGKFRISNVPEGKYELEVYTDFRSMEPTPVEIKEGETTLVDVELTPGDPFLDLQINQNMFTPDETPQVICHGYSRTSDTIVLKVYKVNTESFISEFNASLYSLLASSRKDKANKYGYYDHSSYDLDKNTHLSRTDSLTKTIASKDAEGIFRERVDINTPGPGLYVIGAESDEITRAGWVMVTSLGVVTKSAGDELLCYVTDLKTGKPIPQAALSVHGAKTPTNGTSDSKGLASFTIPGADKEYTRTTVVAKSKGSFAFLNSSFYPASHDAMDLYLYTDRPVYRPGDKVHFKGIVRKKLDDRYETPEGRTVTVQVRDARDTLLYKKQLKTNEFGTFSGEISTGDESPTGYYSIVTRIAGDDREKYSYFQVKSYKKPEVSIDIDFEKKKYTRGETVTATIKAEYFFGAPVAGAKINYYVRKSPYWLFGSYMDDEDEEDIYYDSYGYGEDVIEGQAVTDENGEAVIAFDATWDTPEEEWWDTDQLFTVDVEASDISDQMVSESKAVLVTRGAFGLQVTPEKYVVAPGEDFKVKLQAQNFDGNPIGDQKMKVLFGVAEWDSDTHEYDFLEISEQTVSTGDDGEVTIELSSREGGELRIIAEATDDKGNVIRESAWVWCYSRSGSSWRNSRFADLKIVPSKKEYASGETAEVLINTSDPGATALVTVEADRIYEKQVVELKSNSTKFSFKVREEYKPNVYVSVCVVKNKQFMRRQKRVKVSIENEAVNVNIQPNKDVYSPGDRIKYTVTATDADGNPARAELSLGVVDESIYSILPDRTTPILDFFYKKRYNNVSTNFSFPAIYLDGDKELIADEAKMAEPESEDDVKVRKRFEDTAFWMASIVTDKDGRAEISFELPDNLTSWRATARAITKDTRCGQTTNNVKARKELMARLILPRFAVQDDEFEVAAVIHNYTGKTQKVRVNLRASGLSPQDDRQQYVTLANDETEKVTWKVHPQKPGDFEVSVFAKAEKASDAMELILPVYPHGEERQKIVTDVMTGEGEESLKMNIRTDAITEASRLKVRLSPSIASSILGSLEYLAKYPYGCVEQTTSSFLPDIVVWRTLKQLGINNPELEQKLPDMVKKGLGRLYNFQNSNGGWGWGRYGSSDVWMTSYVCYALVTARNAGFQVNASVLDNGLSRLSQMLADKRKLKIKNEQLAFGYFTLALAGQNVAAELASISRYEKDAKTQALATLGLARLGATDDAKDAYARLLATGIYSPGYAHWQSEKRYGYFGRDEVETTAFALMAMLKMDPEEPKIFDTARWLMERRSGGYWYSTRSTAFTLYAMSDYLAHTGETSPDYSAQISVNGKEHGSFVFDKTSIGMPEKAITVEGVDLIKGANEIKIEKTGAGTLYYSTDMKQFISRKKIPAKITDAGITIKRSYYLPDSKYWRTGEEEFIGGSVKECNVQDVVLVRINVESQHDFDHMLIEDWIPAGFEIVDKGYVEPWQWYYWYVDRDIRDHKISFYVENLNKGKHQLTYEMRATVPGSYHAMPAQVFAMYDPTVRTTTAESAFEVRE